MEFIDIIHNLRYGQQKTGFAKTSAGFVELFLEKPGNLYYAKAFTGYIQYLSVRLQ
jgi:hypothetical protein